MSSRLLQCGATVLAVAFATATASAQKPVDVTKDNAIKGEMSILFNSRVDGSESKVDKYTFKLNVADFVSFEGDAQRVPETSVEYNVKLVVHNPSDPKATKQVGQMHGIMGIDSAGKYQLRSTSKVKIADTDRLRNTMITVPQGGAKENYFDGAIQGKKPKTKGWFAKWKAAAKKVKEYTRNIGGKTVKVTIEDPDILGFESLALGAGPYPAMTEVSVNGSLDYDYSSFNWITERISMKYMADGKQSEDVITGSIRWVEEEGKWKNEAGQEKSYTGYYDFNLRFNEHLFAANSGGDAFFGSDTSDEDIFFAADNKIPSLLGRVYYYDSAFVGEGDDELPTKSEIYYALKSNKLTQIQLANFMKLWLMCIGPANDE